MKTQELCDMFDYDSFALLLMLVCCWYMKHSYTDGRGHARCPTTRLQGPGVEPPAFWLVDDRSAS